MENLNNFISNFLDNKYCLKNKLYNGYGEIFLGDCFDLLKYIPDGTIDLIATDPPYEINFENNDWDKKQINWSFLSNEFLRVLKQNGNLILFQGWSNVVKTINNFNKKFILKNWIIFDRIKGRGAKTNFVSTREDILWFIKSEKYQYNKMPSNIIKKTRGMGDKNGTRFRALSNVWTDISPIVPWDSERVNHPTQKPVALMNRIVNIFSKKDDIVLDCFAGSGTTAVSCIKNKRKFICFEKDIKYFNLSKKRIKNVIKEIC
ncbi:MAG: site-specific DNA-methyltransferase [Bdellovibrionales bacterium]|nr:site-specific DNA-methyltransferase [Bdellovibrionales bacterium]